MQLRDALNGIEVLENWGDLAVDVRSVTHDSRRSEPGTLFCCVPGSRADGHDFASAAVAAGAAALIVERPVPVDVPAARVRRVRDVMAPIAANVYGDPSRAMLVIGVTGTNGKTTTVHLLESIFGAAGLKPGSIGTVGARIGGELLAIAHTTPEAPDVQRLLAGMRGAGVGAVAMEVSSEGIAQGRADAIWFGATCFTNLSQDHLNFHGTMEAYFAAKAELFTPARTPTAAINIDDEYGRRLAVLATERGVTTVPFGIDDEPRPSDGHRARVSARRLQSDAGGTRFELVDVTAGTAAPVHVSLPGRHNVANALAAAAAAIAAGLPFAAVAAGLSRPVTVPGRLEAVGAGQAFTVLVDYAHTPDALESVLSAVREMAGSGRVVAVFGCGGDRDRDKRPLMGAIAGRLADAVYVTSDNPRSEPPDAIAAAVARGVESAGVTPHVELDRRAAIFAAVGAARPGDVVLIAGKGHETGQTTAGVTVAFDDRIVAREAIEAQCS